MKSSAKFTQLVVRIGYVGLTAALFLVPYFLGKGSLEQYNSSFNSSWITVPFYCVVPAGYVALVCIDVIMQNVKNENVFCNKIAKLLKIIVWCCFYAGCVGLISFVLIFALNKFAVIYMFILALGEYFMALICNVLKSCFEAGNLIKEENDLTI
ncbi:MAG: DUF2975 domain-containing protein [Clostridia bacterium]|nr:DUF2975 domain-containing protein [Clostridia bacterium]